MLFQYTILFNQNNSHNNDPKYGIHFIEKFPNRLFDACIPTTPTCTSCRKCRMLHSILFFLLFPLYGFWDNPFNPNTDKCCYLLCSTVLPHCVRVSLRCCYVATLCTDVEELIKAIIAKVENCWKKGFFFHMDLHGLSIFFLLLSTMALQTQRIEWVCNGFSIVCSVSSQESTDDLLRLISRSFYFFGVSFAWIFHHIRYTNARYMRYCGLTSILPNISQYATIWDISSVEEFGSSSHRKAKENTFFSLSLYIF